ncbi:helix-turn-helix domain-containing protein [Tianweitania sediminis]|uniref:Helix-turn-helix transcriptional regulator n=1 Tax=Tianweitania sediminis TaxID=1502156 RepID=A0A8J7R1Y2_9HYPH|nr:helix-turn-helix transcriptional regulator [Tianweitania sediminis]MBP0441353.1 helix-turn-helix transcriptional regulator [Tianweitania sediminis]
MYSHPQQGVPADEVLRLRQAAGAYIRKYREALGLSQRALAKEIGIEHYTFVSQIESGRGRVPPAQMVDWARALQIPQRTFAIQMMRFYDPLTFNMIFTEESAQLFADDRDQGDRSKVSDLEARLAKLESLVANR